jgi:hypothetical protein
MPPEAPKALISSQLPAVCPYWLYPMYTPIPATTAPKMENTEKPGTKKNSTKMKITPTKIIVMINAKLMVLISRLN